MITRYRVVRSLLLALPLLAILCWLCTKTGRSEAATLIRAAQLSLSDAFAFTGPFSASSPTSFDGVQYAASQAGATADVKLNACISALPANGGTCDARGFGATSQTVAATVTVGTTTKTVTLLLDRTTNFNCTITNNTPCFKKGPGSAMVGMGSAITNPNAGITFSSSAAISAAIFDQQQNGGNFVGSHIEGVSIFGNATMTVSDAFLSIQCPLQVSDYNDINIGSSTPNAVGIKVYGTTSCGAGNADIRNVLIDMGGAAGANPIWIGCASAGSLTLVACSTIGVQSISIGGGASAITHPGTGLPIIDIECGNGAGGTNTCGGFNIHELQIESKHATDIGILANGPESLHVYGLFGTCNTTCGADLVKIAQPAGTTLDGVVLSGLDNQGGWTNTINNTVIPETLAFVPSTRTNYYYSATGKSGTNVWSTAAGRVLTVDPTAVSGKNIPILAALVTTAAASDNVTVTGMTASGHCNLTPTNTAGATNIATTFVSAKAANQITVTHAVTANMNYDISCTPN